MTKLDSKTIGLKIANLRTAIKNGSVPDRSVAGITKNLKIQLTQSQIDAMKIELDNLLALK